MINERVSSGGGEHLSYDNASHEKLNAQTSRDCLSHHMHIPKKKTSPSTSSLGGNISEDSDLLEVSFQSQSRSVVSVISDVSFTNQLGGIYVIAFSSRV